MDPARFGLRLLQGAGLSLLAAVAFCGLLFLRGSWCWNCRGKGGSLDPDFPWTCQECLGDGYGRQLHLRLHQYGTASWRLALVRNGENVWEGDPRALPVLSWLGAGVVVLIGLVVGLRGGVCPLCAAHGTLLLAGEPP